MNTAANTDTWDVEVLYFGKISMPLSTMLSVCYVFGAPVVKHDPYVSAPYLGFLLTRAERRVVVDTGISAKFIVDGKAWAGLEAEGGEAYVRRALAEKGLGPGDIQTVLYTHLHNDHAGNCGLFPQARHVFQRAEWENLLNPLPIQNVRKDYDAAIIDEFALLQTQVVEGDFGLEPGIDLYATPGHTRGSQSIAVRMRKGTVVLVGDLLTSYVGAFPQTRQIEDMEGLLHDVPPAPEVFGNAIPSSVTYDFYEWYESVKRVQSIASRNEPGFVIPGHETSLVAKGL
ncbi:MAG: N-acyl homoserine lactonase family protein [Thermoleophilia bacterium]